MNPDIGDRYSVYNQHPGRRQSCLAHIDRSLAKIEQKEEVNAFLGKTSQKELGKIFALWHEYKAEKFSKEELQGKTKDPSKTLERFLCLRWKRQKFVKANP